jgi:hypothetical protein
MRLNDVCPLCAGTLISNFAELDRRYLECADCRLVFVSRADLPDRTRERQQYLFHENRVDDPRYRLFLARLWDPLKARLANTAQTALDYGAGPGPALAAMMEESGLSVSIYDPFFAPDESVLDHRYDVITCTETAEHFHQPSRDFHRLAQMIAPGGMLGLMTTLLEDDVDFENWHYRRDVTHVSFYRKRTIDFIAGKYGLRLRRPSATVFLFLRPPSAIS